MIIYVDVLIVLNAYIDYILLLSTEKLIHIRVKTYRRVIGTLVGALSSLSIFLPIDSRALSVAIGLISSVLISLTVFGFHTFKELVKAVMTLYILTCAYAGGMMLIWSVTGNSSIVIKNNVVYYNISPVMLIVTTVIIYAVLTVCRKLILRGKSVHKCTVDITCGKKTVRLNAMIDTGNTLYDQLSGLPVIIVDRQTGTELTGIDLSCYGELDMKSKSPPGFRLIPCNSVTGKGCLPGFRPDSIIMVNDGEYSMLKSYVAVSDTVIGDGIHCIVGAQTILDKESLTCC